MPSLPNVFNADCKQSVGYQASTIPRIAAGQVCSGACPNRELAIALGVRSRDERISMSWMIGSSASLTSKSSNASVPTVSARSKSFPRRRERRPK